MHATLPITVPVAIGLGSNRGNRDAYLDAAIEALTQQPAPLLTNAQASPRYENPAWLPEGAPESWNRPFLNMVLRGHTTLSPLAALARLQTIELQLGRVKDGVWGPREIDLDLLIYGDARIQTPSLTTPHPGLIQRNFVLRPLADIWPEWQDPVTGQTAETLCAKLDCTSLTPWNHTANA